MQAVQLHAAAPAVPAAEKRPGLTTSPGGPVPSEELGMGQSGDKQGKCSWERIQVRKNDGGHRPVYVLRGERA